MRAHEHRRNFDGYSHAVGLCGDVDPTVYAPSAIDQGIHALPLKQQYDSLLLDLATLEDRLPSRFIS
jgi:hypothetical protein